MKHNFYLNWKIWLILILPILLFILFSSNYTGASGVVIERQLAEAPITFLYNNITNFTGLFDVPDTYVGSAAKCVKVNAGESGVEFASCDSTYNSTYAKYAYNFSLANTTISGAYNFTINQTLATGVSVKSEITASTFITFNGSCTILGGASGGRIEAC